jgi:hypothetical protein
VRARFSSIANLLAAATLALGACQAQAQEPLRRPTSGNLGGPYKVVAAELTGDDAVDLILGFHNSDAVTVERGGPGGKFTRWALFGVPHDDHPVIETVHNLDHGDVDGDGRADLALAVGGGLPESMTGRIVIVRNLGQGRFERIGQFTVESQAKGVRLVDLDRDGRLDLVYTARGSGYPGDTAIGKLTIRQGLGDGKFGPGLDHAAGASAYYVESGDLDNDGFVDLVVPNEHANTVTYFLNPGKDILAGAKPLVARVVHVGKLRPQERTANVNDVRAADFNGDGRLDLVTANLGPSTVAVWLGRGDGTFHQEALYDGGVDCTFLAVGDLDRDGDRDFVVTHWTGDFLSAFLNRGDGTFAPRVDYPAALGSYGVALCDVDADDKLDAVTANYRDRSISLLLGAGDGTFQPAVTLNQTLRLENGQWR